MCTTSNRVYIVGLDLRNRTAFWARPDCHSWSCPDCAETNKRRWTAIVAHGIEVYQETEGTSWQFCTVTSHEAGATFNQTLFMWRQRWPKLYARMKRHDNAIKYVFIPEKHRDGRLHMHALTNATFNKRWLKDNARSCGFGFMADVQPLMSVAQACSYCLKYIAKSLNDPAHWPKSLHRVRTNQHWPKVTVSDQMPQPCVFRPVPPSAFKIMLTDWQKAGLMVVNFQTGETGDFETPPN